ncbi:hypothetical protein BH10PAT2_BH10PAT2_2670 [soil metagenome]
MKMHMITNTSKKRTEERSIYSSVPFCYDEVMWNFSDRKMDVRTVLIIFSILIVLAGVIFVIVMSGALSKSEVQRPPVTPLVDGSIFVPVNEIQPILKPCMFVLLNSCSKLVNVDKATDPNPISDPTANTGEESIARQDVFNALSNTPNKGLASYQVLLSNAAVTQYFPEYVKDASSSAVTVPAPVAIARIAAKYDVNQRVLLLLMETLNQGSGPLFSSTMDFSRPYYATDDGFFAQLVSVASELQGEKTKFVLLDQSNQLPTSLKYFDKTYPVQNPTVESLALVDFLGQKLGSKKSFERAIYAPSANDSSGADPVQNFDLLYKLIFDIDPR